MSDIEELYNPSISDLELDEHQGKDRPVIYLDQAIKVLESREAEIERKARLYELNSCKKIVEKLRDVYLTNPDNLLDGEDPMAEKVVAMRNHLRDEIIADLEMRIEEIFTKGERMTQCKHGGAPRR